MENFVKRKAKLITSASVIERHDNADELWTSLLAVLKEVGIDYAIYVTCGPDQSNIQLRTNLDFQHLPDLAHFDPFLKYCCDSYEATRTGVSYIDDYPYLDDASREFICHAAKLGFTSGIALPVKADQGSRYGGFNLGTSLDRAEFEQFIMPLESELRTLALIVHRRFLDLGETSPIASIDTPHSLTAETINLTDREKDILYLISKGHSRKECARFCDLSVHTVSDYVKSLYKKLGVSTRYAATERAKVLGLISARAFK